jgi:isocitrate lyase
MHSTASRLATDSSYIDNCVVARTNVATAAFKRVCESPAKDLKRCTKLLHSVTSVAAGIPALSQASRLAADISPIDDCVVARAEIATQLFEQGSICAHYLPGPATRPLH